LRSKAGEKKKKFNILDLVERSYHWVLEKTFKYPRLTIFLGFFTVLIGIWIFSFLPQKMMPYADRDQFAVEIYLPTGSSLDQTEAVSDSVYQILKADDRVVSITQFNGMSSPRFQSGYAPNLADKNYAQFIVNTTSNKATKELLNEYTEPLSYRYPQAYVRFKELEYTTVATPLEVRFKGDNIEDLKKSSRILREHLVAVKELSWVHDNYGEPLSSIEVELDPLQASRLAISKAHATAELGMINDGITVGSVWEGDYKLPIHLESKVLSITDKMDGVKDQYITSGVLGTRVPLSQVAQVKASWHEGQIVRRNGVRCLTVQALYKKGSYVSDAQKKIEQVMETQVKKLLPKGVTYSYGGDKEFDAEVMNPMMSGLLISVVIIFFFLVFMYKKIGLAMAALSSLALCVFGSALGLLTFNMAFSVTCVLGIISLMGSIVRNTIVMFDHAQDLRLNKKKSAREAAYDAGKRRMMPIFLTSATTAMGVVPMILGKSSLWMPMGCVIFVGMIVSMILTVTVLPVLYWQIFNHK